jgi:hypothetical protein
MEEPPFARILQKMGDGEATTVIAAAAVGPQTRLHGGRRDYAKAANRSVLATLREEAAEELEEIILGGGVGRDGSGSVCG